MDQKQLETLLADVEEIKKAIKRNNPLLRELVSGRFFPVMSLIFGFITIVFCTGTQLYVNKLGSFANVPFGWKTGGWIAVCLYFAVGWVWKWSYLVRQARKVEEGANFTTIVRVFFLGSGLHINTPAVLCMAMVPVFAILVGHPWYIIPGLAIFMIFPCNNLGLAIKRPEYLAAGWYSLITGMIALFFIESMPFVWTEIIWGGYLILFGIVGLAVKDRSTPA